MYKTAALIVSLLPLVALGQQTVISGKLAGSDGKPMIKANVELFRMTEQTPLVSIEAGQDGSFSVSTAERGLLRIQFSGVNHMFSNVPVLADIPTTIEMSVRLAAYPYKETIEAPKVIGNFNNFDFTKPTPMTKQPDGTFAADFGTQQREFKYQIIDVLEETRSINGTQSERFEFDGGGDYQSVVTPKNGQVRIIFDTRAIVRSDMKEKVIFSPPDRAEAKMLDAYNEVMAHQQAFQKAAIEYRDSGKDPSKFSYDVSKPLNSIAHDLSIERDPFARQLLFMKYLGISPFTREFDSSIVRQALEEIPMESGIWCVSPGLILAALHNAGAGFDDDMFMNEFLANNPDKTYKSIILYNLMLNAKFSQREEEYKKYYLLLVADYGDTQLGMAAKQRFSIETAIVVGKKVPEFKLASLDNKTTVSNALFNGKFTLLDFWAVWCGPCIREMESMHKAYERFKGKNLQIISFSFDPKPEDVREFRATKWKMPWIHAFVEGGFQSALANTFEVMGIPKPILVDGEGTILAMEVDLRGSNLEKTLEKFLGK